jgi:ATP adenylyltransferase
MDRLWAPWRIDYIKGPKDAGCIFCDALAQSDDRATLVLHRGRTCFVILNKYPYNNGHLMVAPVRHTADFGALTDAESLEAMRLLRACHGALTATMAPHGFNGGINLGRCAGAGVEDHLHFHLVPRWNGDTNFMPALGGTRVISEHILETYDALRPRFAGLARGEG